MNDVHIQLDALTDAFFRAVSFRVGEKPEYNRIYDLFIDGGLLIKNSEETPQISTVGQFIAPRQLLVDSGELVSFAEAEIAHQTEIFGRIAHRLSTYTKSTVTTAGATEARGVISTQFVETATGWRMSAMAWDDERPGLTIPNLRQV